MCVLDDKLIMFCQRNLLSFHLMCACFVKMFYQTSKLVDPLTAIMLTDHEMIGVQVV